jgi:hypothetical protein
MENSPRNRLCRLVAVTIPSLSGLVLGVSASHANLYVSATHYSEAKTLTSCGTTNTCALPFQKVASGKTLMITHVSCRIVAKSTVAPLTRAVLIDNGGQAREILTPVLLATDGQSVQYFQSKDDTHTILGAGMTPKVSVTFDGSIAIQELTCSLAGEFL